MVFLHGTLDVGASSATFRLSAAEVAAQDAAAWDRGSLYSVKGYVLLLLVQGT